MESIREHGMSQGMFTAMNVNENVARPKDTLVLEPCKVGVTQEGAVVWRIDLK